MTGWTWELSQFIADLADWYPLGELGLVLTLLLLATLVALGSQGRRLLPTRSPVRDEVVFETTADFDDTDEVPDLPSDGLRQRARAYMAAGEHKLAVREWLRASVRDLIDREYVDHRPGWTVTELARAATGSLPVVADWMDEAALVFSDIWYGRVAATAGHAGRMEELDGMIAAAADGRLAGSGA
ncbi:hypothetical protein Afil01_10600 [Actinorhabdospora filicis]|uniref:Protein-glutamine gamma-glutamyltransferase-like C-terminal domain-containing protein n=1 Tax=Actinorhabdospora filicis TaxID=1785913 RepID=A0A9W6W7T3_9ACTN|nr:DUF4129 domain-containing protein [Actinorhabdospora filicis]GLZ76253.1 hypothetical protein Afil01_10600 [Actinorhabdospora filicis]